MTTNDTLCFFSSLSFYTDVLREKVTQSCALCRRDSLGDNKIACDKSAIGRAGRGGRPQDVTAKLWDVTSSMRAHDT